MEQITEILTVKDTRLLCLAIATIVGSLYGTLILFQNTIFKTFPNYTKSTIGTVDNKICRHVVNNQKDTVWEQLENFRKTIDSEPLSKTTYKECLLKYTYYVENKIYRVETEMGNHDEFHVNDKILVHYDTMDPKNSILIRKDTIFYQYFYFLCIFFFILFSFGSFLLYYQW